MQKEIKKSKKKETRVNIYNEKEMKSLGLRSDNVSPRDPNVWTKSKKEKNAIKKAKRIYKNNHPYENWHIGNCPEPYLPYKCKLIVYLRKNKVFDKSTYSYECTPNDIKSYLNKFEDKKGSCVRKYKYNGKDYNVEEVPAYML